MAAGPGPAEDGLHRNDHDETGYGEEEIDPRPARREEARPFQVHATELAEVIGEYLCMEREDREGRDETQHLHRYDSGLPVARCRHSARVQIHVPVTPRTAAGMSTQGHPAVTAVRSTPAPMARSAPFFARREIARRSRH